MNFFMCNGGPDEPSEEAPGEPPGMGIFTCGSDSAETYEQAMQRCRVQRQAPFDVTRIDDVEPASLEWWSGESHDLVGDQKLEILTVVPKHATIELLRDERQESPAPASKD